MVVIHVPQGTGRVAVPEGLAGLYGMACIGHRCYQKRTASRNYTLERSTAEV